MEKVNKAEEKRIKQARETLAHQLAYKMVDFKERYLKSYVEYRFNEFDRMIKIWEERVFKKDKYGTTLEQFNIDKARAIDKIKKKKAFTYTNTLEFIREASDGYDLKFDRLVETLISHGVRSYPLNIEKIGGGTNFDFSFLITHATTIKTVQVYARIIFACGEINTPHYRFIITANKNEKH